MALDPNIILSGKGPQFDNPMDSMQKALSLKNMLQTSQQNEAASAEKNTMRDILKKNVVTGPDGKASLNREAVMADLYKVNPEKAMAYQKEFETQDFENLKKHTEAAKTLAWQATPENWPEIRKQAIQLGLPNSDKLPEMYSEQFDQKWKMGTLNGAEQIARMQQEKDTQFKENEDTRKANESTANIAKTKAETSKLYREAQAGKSGGGKLEGIKALDKDYAKDYNDWTSTGRASVEKNLQRLREAKAALESDPSLTGSIRGNMPDVIRNFTNENAIKTRDNVRAAAQGALKATLGAQFTEKEGERIMNQSYNEKLSPEANLEKINLAIQELETGAANNDLKARYFQQNKSLDGFDSFNSAGSQQAKSKPSWAK